MTQEIYGKRITDWRYVCAGPYRMGIAFLTLILFVYHLYLSENVASSYMQWVGIFFAVWFFATQLDITRRRIIAFPKRETEGVSLTVYETKKERRLDLIIDTFTGIFNVFIALLISLIFQNLFTYLLTVSLIIMTIVRGCIIWHAYKNSITCRSAILESDSS